MIHGNRLTIIDVIIKDIKKIFALFNYIISRFKPPKLSEKTKQEIVDLTIKKRQRNGITTKAEIFSWSWKSLNPFVCSCPGHLLVEVSVNYVYGKDYIYPSEHEVFCPYCLAHTTLPKIEDNLDD